MKNFLLFLFKLIGGLLLAGLLFIVLVRQNSPLKTSLSPVSRISDSHLRGILGSAFRAQCRFIQPDLLWVTLPPGVDAQAKCQAIANVWAHHSGLPYVRVESWHGNQRLAQATVWDGFSITPKPSGVLTPPTPALDVAGLTLAEVESRHGPALSRDAVTGWALWPAFRARFAAGRVERAEILPSDL